MSIALRHKTRLYHRLKDEVDREAPLKEALEYVEGYLTWSKKLLYEDLDQVFPSTFPPGEKKLIVAYAAARFGYSEGARFRPNWLQIIWRKLKRWVRHLKWS